MESYLTDRKQTVMANQMKSASKRVKQGVPQGSILGPLLYILYANDIEGVIRKSKVAFYAEDTVIYASSNKIASAIKRVQKDLTNLLTWFSQNGLFMNPSKTKYMIFSNKKTDYNNNINKLNVSGTPIQQVPSCTYLGVALETHAKQVLNTVAAKVYQLRRVRKFLNDKAALLIYKNMILPIMEYGDIYLT